MPIAIIIGFQYDSPDNKLDGVIIDIYLSTKWFKKAKYEVKIITDVKVDSLSMSTSTIDKALSLGIVQEDIKYLLRDTQEEIFYSSDVVTFSNNFQNLLEKVNDKDKGAIIYYTGHGINNSFILPNGELLHFNELRDMITSKISPTVEILIILDCCNPSGLGLPFELTNNSFRLREGALNFFMHKILLITSSKSNEKSVALQTGSLFSRKLFELLTEMCFDRKIIYDPDGNIIIPNSKNRNLQLLANNLTNFLKTMNTGYNQTVTIYSSYVIHPVLWLWVGENNIIHSFDSQKLF